MEGWRQARDESRDRGYVYFCRRMDTGDIKIGTTVSLSRRLYQIGIATRADIELEAVIPSGGYQLEKYIHQVLADTVVSHEWFQASPLSEDLILDIRAEHGDPLLTNWPDLPSFYDLYEAASSMPTIRAPAFLHGGLYRLTEPTLVLLRGEVVGVWEPLTRAER